MNKIITISREFGSGGRELGKRLSELLGYAYYDKEIIEQISQRTQLAESYVQQIVDRKPNTFFPITTSHSMHGDGSDYLMKQHASVYAEQTNVLFEMAEKSDCIIVGRCADYILKDFNPLRIYVYANMEAKLKRCYNKANPEEELTRKQMLRIINRIDKDRAKYYHYYTGRKWGDHVNYDLCVNSSVISVKELAESLAHILKKD